MIFLQLYNFVERKLAANAAYHRTFDELSLFTDRELFEIHMSSADIPHLAAEAAHEAEEKLRQQGVERLNKARSLAA